MLNEVYRCGSIAWRVIEPTEASTTDLARLYFRARSGPNMMVDLPTEGEAIYALFSLICTHTSARENWPFPVPAPLSSVDRVAAAFDKFAEIDEAFLTALIESFEGIDRKSVYLQAMKKVRQATDEYWHQQLREEEDGGYLQ